MQASPQDIQCDTTNDQIHFSWSDTDPIILSYSQLRENCPCSFCRYSRFKKQPISSKNMDDIKVTALNSFGYGLQICFNDGHDKGIFPWDYLIQIASTES